MAMRLVNVKQLSSFVFHFWENADSKCGTVQNMCVVDCALWLMWYREEALTHVLWPVCWYFISCFTLEGLWLWHGPIPLWGKHESLEDRFCLSHERNRNVEVFTSGPKGFASDHALKKPVVRKCPSCLCSETTSPFWKTCVWVLLGLFSL